MNCSKVLLKYFGECSWRCGDTYESLKWIDTTIDKPTKEYLEGLWVEVLKGKIRKERNQLLKDCDFKVLVDYPNTNKEAWELYRHNLRTLPETWSESNPAFPSPPE